ncbi:MAG: hypothetical protein AAFS10_26735 [Myxococcota bacterium]
MDFVEPPRARRRRLTTQIAERRRADLIRLWHNGEPHAGHKEERSPYYWAKLGIGSRACRKRRCGAPRRNKGMCDIEARGRIYQLRAQARKLDHLVRHRGVNWDSDEVALLCGGRIIKDP